MSLIKLDNLIEKRNYSFILISRFTQDCIGNLFSILDLKNSTLNALRFKTNLKLIAISYYISFLLLINYSYNDRELLSDFLKYDLRIKRKKRKLFNIYINLFNIEGEKEHME